MKKFSNSFIFLFLIFCVACEQTDVDNDILPETVSTSEPIITVSPGVLKAIPIMPVTSFQLDEFALDKPFRPSSNPISPNGEWELIEYIEGAVQVKNIEQPATRLTSEYDDRVGAYVMWPQWSPDSQAIASPAADKGAAGCPTERIVIYSFSDDNTLNTAIFPPSNATQPILDCPRISWSPDGSRVAVVSTVNADAIYILDQQAEIQQTITLTWLLPEQPIDRLFWEGDSLYYLSRIHNNAGVLLWELHRVPVDVPDDHSVLLQSDVHTYTVWGISADGHYLLVYQHSVAYPPSNTFEFLVVSLTGVD